MLVTYPVMSFWSRPSRTLWDIFAVRLSDSMRYSFSSSTFNPGISSFAHRLSGVTIRLGSSLFCKRKVTRQSESSVGSSNLKQSLKSERNCTSSGWSHLRTSAAKLCMSSNFGYASPSVFNAYIHISCGDLNCLRILRLGVLLPDAAARTI